MRIVADVHTHTNYSGDSEASMESMILAAIDAGLEIICFTEHMDVDFPITEETPKDFFVPNTDAFLFDAIRMKNKYQDQIEVLFGLEIGMQPHLARENARIAKDHDYDFIIGSQHVCHGADPYFPSFWEGKNPEDVLEEYFEATYENIRTYGNFDSLGHLDYVIRYAKELGGTYDFTRYQVVLDKILKYLIARDKALEVNTGAFRCGLSDPNPSIAILKRYRELGGELITIGSDAHKPEDVASGFEKAAEILRELGFTTYVVFSGRIPIHYSL